MFLNFIYMQVIHKVKTENIDDLWYLSHIIDKGDLVKGQTIRKIKLGKKEEKPKITKKRVFLTIEVEKTEFKENLLRIYGIVREGPEDVPKGSHHTLSLSIKENITIIKEKWLGFQLDKLKEAASAKRPNILICILDREKALFALSKRKGYDILSSIEGDVEKKAEKTIPKSSFYSEIIKILEGYSNKYKVKNIIIASPAFWKEELIKHLKDHELKDKIVLATCSSVSRNAVNEVLKRPEVNEILKQDRIAKEIKIVEELLVEISKRGLAAYGIKEVNLAAEMGAVKDLLITDSFITKTREKGNYDKIDNIMKITDQTKGQILIISSEHEGGKKLDGLGGIAAILRFRIS